MPYYHERCDGKIRWLPPGVVSPKCLKCGRTWPRWVVFGGRPKDMYFIPGDPPTIIKKGDTSYAKWADKAPPGVAEIASNLPNWPRWKRLTVFLLVILIMSGGFYGLSLVGTWAVLLAVVILVLIPLVARLLKRRG